MNPIKALKSRFITEEHEPTWLSIFFNPFYFARKGILDEIKKLAPRLTGKTLDIGCGGKPYARYCGSSQYFGLEIDTAENRARKIADYFYDGKKVPFPDQSFDSVLTSQVFEHVFDPDLFLSETNRILKPNGYLLITAPFVWDEHEKPFDFARYSSYGLRSMLEKQSFEIIEQHKSIADLRVIIQLLICYFHRRLHVRHPHINLLVSTCWVAPLNIFGILAGLILPGNEDLFLNNVILAKKKNE